MEEGSLLAEALGNVGAENHLENALVVDVFLLPGTAITSKNENSNNNNNLEQHLLDLAELGVGINDFIKQRTRSSKVTAEDDTYDTTTTNSSCYYPWIQGGDGPVFGIHTSLMHDNNDATKKTTTATVQIPHLRAICRYGVSVADEWKMIGLMMEFSSLHSNQQHNQQQQDDDDDKEKNKTKKMIVVECMDIDDGQILMIQGADALPEWADLIGPQNCRHRCWIKHGKIHLIAPPSPPDTTDGIAKSPSNNNSNNSNSYSLSLSQALDCLLLNSDGCNSSSNSSSTNNTVHKNTCRYHAGVHGHVQQAVERVNNNDSKQYCQRTALLIPRSVANLVSCRPDLAAVAYLAWAQQRQEQHQQHPHHPERRRQRQGDTRKASCNIKDPNQNVEQSSASSSLFLLAGTCHDWIWTIDNHMSRTVYAMMRTMVSSSSSSSPVLDDDDWTSPDSIPKRYQSIEVKRLQRHVQSLQHLPVLQSSLALGVRLVAGLQLLLVQQQTKKNMPTTDGATSMRQSHVERRVLDFWSRIDRQCRCAADTNSIATTTAPIIGTRSTIDTSNDDDSNNNNCNSWLVQAWMAGPNHSQYNIESIMKCPVFAEEVEGIHAITPLSHPDITLADQIRQELLRPSQQQLQSEIPRPDQVDTDEWMTLPSLTTDQDLLFQKTLGLSSFTNLSEMNPEAMDENNENNESAAAASPLDHMLHGIQDFIEGESGIDGVEHHHQGSGPSSNNNSWQDKSMPQQPIRIHPVAFLNLLHKSLAADSAQELETFLIDTVKTSGDDHVGGDAFFSEEDYRLAEPDSTDDDGSSTSTSSDSHGGNNGDDEEMMDLMNAMDSQLEHDGEGLSRPGIDAVRVDDDLDATCTKLREQDEIARDVHVLSNLIESLEAGAGAPGPVQNILSEMSGK